MSEARTFDGILCFGGLDWWYHNRGHFDMQMMRELSAHVPVVYINSIAMRIPKVTEGAMFLKRIQRKWKSLRRGLVRIDDRFAVFTPFAIPGRVGTAMSRLVVPHQVKRAGKALGMQRPLVWVAVPPAARFLDALKPNGLIYQRTDRFEAFSGVDRPFIESCDRTLKTRADITIFCAHELLDTEEAQCRKAVFVDHGVDYERFARAGDTDAALPPDMASIPYPRVGFVGGIDSHTFDPPLFLEVARRLPDVQFFLVGACSLPENWCPLPNVRLLGQRPFEQVAAYMAAADVLIMPWNKSEWIRACNPVKLKEYLAVGRPIVTSPFRELENYEGLVHIATDAPSFAAGIEQCLGEPFDRRPGRRRVQGETWTAKATDVLSALERAGWRAAPH